MDFGKQLEQNKTELPFKIVRERLLADVESDYHNWKEISERIKNDCDALSRIKEPISHCIKFDPAWKHLTNAEDLVTQVSFVVDINQPTETIVANFRRCLKAAKDNIKKEFFLTHSKIKNISFKNWASKRYLPIIDLYIWSEINAENITNDEYINFVFKYYPMLWNRT